MLTTTSEQSAQRDYSPGWVETYRGKNEKSNPINRTSGSTELITKRFFQQLNIVLITAQCLARTV